MPKIVKIGDHSSRIPELLTGLKTELRIALETKLWTQDLPPLFSELGRQNGLVLKYLNESWGYRVQCEDDSAASFLHVFAKRYGLAFTAE